MAKPIEVTCESCGSDLEGRWKYCPYCGRAADPCDVCKEPITRAGAYILRMCEPCYKRAQGNTVESSE